MIFDNVNRLKLKCKEFNGFCFSMDVDWASDFVIEFAIKYFDEKNIPVMFFLTHKNKYIGNLIKNGTIQYGIHPNFIQPSSQGETREDIIKYCLDAFPKTRAFRSHRWYADNDIYTQLYDSGIKYESNLCTMLNVMMPYIHRSGMVSFPVFLEDGAYLYHNLDLRFNNVKNIFAEDGLKVINIHPMHLILNTPYFKYMRDIKDSVSREKWNNMSSEDVDIYRNNSSVGIADFIGEIINYIEKNQIETYSMEDMYDYIAKGAVEG